MLRPGGIFATIETLIVSRSSRFPQIRRKLRTLLLPVGRIQVNKVSNIFHALLLSVTQLDFGFRRYLPSARHGVNIWCQLLI